MREVSVKTPRELGYRMPAEWERHSATWMSWPRPEGVSFPGSFDKVIPTFVRMVEVLTDSESVHVNVESYEQEKKIARLFSAKARQSVRFFHFRTNEPWCRDHGPIFITRKAPAKNEPELALTEWRFNAWGEKYKPFDDDNRIPAEIAEALNLPHFISSLVLEGGSIEVNGTGSLITTESCLLNPNRNPKVSRLEIEKTLGDFLGVQNIIWLKDGIEGDDTDGHVDDMTRFLSPDTVLTVVEEDTNDFNHLPLKENLRRLKEMKLENGKSPNIVTLPMPGRIEREDLRLPASYANYYVANRCVLLPIYADTHDDEAIEVLQSAYPDREIVPLDCRELIWGLGAFHCLTQQQPA